MRYLFSLVGFYSVLPVCNPYQSAAFRYVVYVMPATTESKWPALEDLGFDKSEAGRLSEKPTVGHRINRPAHSLIPGPVSQWTASTFHVLPARRPLFASVATFADPFSYN